MDELTPMGSADIVEVTQDKISRYCLEPKDLGISRWVRTLLIMLSAAMYPICYVSPRPNV